MVNYKSGTVAATVSATQSFHMRKILLSCCLSLFLFNVYAQDSVVNVTHTRVDLSDSLHNRYGDLLNDDPAYNPKYKWWVPALKVTTTNAFNLATSRYVFNYDWARVSTKTWAYNLKHGFEWDTDRFGTNFIGHPHTGNTYFNVARSNGYNFWQSIPYAVGGSLMWEYFGENTRPSTNDIINTPVSGVMLGEIIYRVSSNILDDRTRGRERFFRELLAGLINPTRGLNRLVQGKMSRHTPTEVYQKEPMNITVSAGLIRTENLPGSSTKYSGNAIANVQLDYGSPFENRKRKPFDLFRFRTELSYGNDAKLLGNVNGYGILTGKNMKEGRLLGGLFQHFDYFNNRLFQVGAIGFGGGLVSRIKVGRTSNIFSNIHLALVPFAGNNTRFGPDTSDYRQYNFGGGFEGKLEETFNIGNKATIGFTGFYYYIHTYNGIPGNSLIGILKPNLTIKLFKNLSIGYEHFIYQNDRFLTNSITNPNLHITRVEQRAFLQLFFEDSKRSGSYH
ncbi:MAG: hypothetical protein JWQ27_285 [Ferruginibacter sp.]|nr:hypothetical protein [Ferruginibacter sp.]